MHLLYRAVEHLDGQQYIVSLDGQRFLINARLDLTTPTITVLLTWRSK